MPQQKVDLQQNHIDYIYLAWAKQFVKAIANRLQMDEKTISIGDVIRHIDKIEQDNAILRGEDNDPACE